MNKVENKPDLYKLGFTVALGFFLCVPGRSHGLLIHTMALVGLPGEIGPRRRVLEEGPPAGN